MKSTAFAVAGLFLNLWTSPGGFCDEPLSAQPIKISGVENAFRVTDQIYSGSQPESDATFAELAKLGVKTILSVDGSKPDVEAARKHGLRYVHLPIGYGGLSTNRIAELAKLTSATNGPFFVHCHHGKHRGPAAAAVMCLASEKWTTNRAEAWLRQAGTSDEYPGLYRAAREFKTPTALQLAAIKELPEVTRTSSVIDAMLSIDEHFGWLKKSQKAAWKTPLGHADISPAHEATMLWEQFREMARASGASKSPEDYHVKLKEGEQAAGKLRDLLRHPIDMAAADAAFKIANQNCLDCHKKYRNE